MEVQANEAFDIYRELYYEGGISSVYFWNLDDGFAGVVLLKKCEPPLHSLNYKIASRNLSVLLRRMLMVVCSGQPDLEILRLLGLDTRFRIRGARPYRPLQVNKHCNIEPRDRK